MAQENNLNNGSGATTYKPFTDQAKANLLANVPVYDQGTLNSLAASFGYDVNDLAAAYQQSPTYKPLTDEARTNLLTNVPGYDPNTVANLASSFGYNVNDLAGAYRGNGTVAGPGPGTTTKAYDYKTDPAYQSWLTANNSEWGNRLNAANSEVNKYKPYADKYNATLADLNKVNASNSALQANLQDASKRITSLSAAQAKSINPTGTVNGSGNNVAEGAPVSMQSYNDNRNAQPSQWWGKYITGRR